MSGYWRLCIRDEFSAGHALRKYEGKCEKPHGHNFTVEICVEGRKLDRETEILLDFKVLKLALKAVLKDMDHCMLNDVPPFDRINPSSENMARHIWQKMRDQLEKCEDGQARLVRLVSVGVCEKSAQGATYFED